MTKTRQQRRRDQDYRGQKPPADFAKLVYMVRRGKPGALEVLQDVIETWFPKQYRQAKEDALVRSAAVMTDRGGKLTAQETVVVFNARTARFRFLRWQDPRSESNVVSPFRIFVAGGLARTGYLDPYTVPVWSTRPGHRPTEKLRRLSRRRRAPFFDVRHPKGPRWYGQVRSPWETPVRRRPR